jgi:hypothetical protein
MMSGKVFVLGFVFVALAFFLLAVLFNYYPPAGNNWLTLLGFAAYVAIAVVIVRRVARK